MNSKVVFVDRDGTMARDVHYCGKVEDFKLLPKVPEAIRLLNDNNFKVIVITNQSGIARGYFTEETLAKIHNKMKSELAKHNAHVDAIYYCPHHPDDNCQCRKPGIDLFLRATRDFNIDLGQSYVVGDLPMDIEAGESLGCRTILVSLQNNLLEASKKIVSKVETSVIIPAYNEERGLPLVLYKLEKVIDENYEVIVVDDGCTDRTLDAVLHYPYQVIGHRVNKGKGEALRKGIDTARGKNIIWIDADDTYPVELIPQIVKALNTNYDAVVCSRTYGKRNIPTFNRIGNWIFRKMIRKIYGFKPHDPCSGLYGIKRKHLLNMHLASQRFAIEPEISIKGARMGLRMLDIPANYKVRVGRTKLNAIKVGTDDLLTILKLVFWRPEK